MGPRTMPLHSVSVTMLDFSVLYPLLLCVPILFLARRRRTPALPYPPGPKGYPILGNVLDLPLSVPIWESLTSLANSQGMFRGCSALLVLNLSLERHGYPILKVDGQGDSRLEQQRSHFGSD